MNVSSWSVDDVSRYMKQLGFEQYTKSFVENDIDGSVLPFLSDNDLKELGIQSIGNRIKIMKFIGTLSKEDIYFPSLNEENDKINPLPQAVYKVLFDENDDSNKVQELQNGDMIKCKICNSLIPLNYLQCHENTCKKAFDRCKEEYKRRGINATDQDILNLFSGEAPTNLIRLKKCEFCNKKFYPSVFAKHQEQCLKRKQNQEQKAKDKQSQNAIEKNNKANYVEKHKQLIDLIHKERKQKSTNNDSNGSIPGINNNK